MGKYITALLNNIKNGFAYRANTIIMMFSVFFSFGVMYFLWSSIYKQGNQIGSYSFNEMITYYLFVTIFELLFVNYSAWGIGEEIKNGEITNIILKPINFLGYKFAQNLGTLAYRLLLFIGVIAIVVYLLRNFIVFPDNSLVFLYFIVLVIIGYMLNFLIYFILGIGAFWMDDVYGFLFAWLVIIGFMQGQWIPLDLLPKWFNVIGDYLPFKYLFFIPIGVVSGKINFHYSFLIVTIIWCVALYILASFMYKRGLKKYEGYGV